MSTRIQSLIIGLGKAKQSDIATASASFLRFTKLNPDPTSTAFTTETDEDEIGKGNEFISENGVFPVAYKPQNRIERYASAEFVTWMLAYGLGGVSEVGGIYTITPEDPTQTIEPLYFSVVEQLGEGGGQAIDNTFLGCAIEELVWEFDTIPGRASSKATVNWVGSGKLTTPSGVSVPAVTADHYMLSQSASISILTEDYAANKAIVSGRIGWKNNLTARYFPGSGLQNGAAIAGALESVKRQVTFEFTSRLRAASDEYSKMIAGTSGTATIQVSFDTSHTVTFAFQSAQFTSVDNGQTNGIATVKTTVAPKFDPTNGLLICTAKCGISGIAQ